LVWMLPHRPDRVRRSAWNRATITHGRRRSQRTM
jgi:hypothetical protein